MSKSKFKIFEFKNFPEISKYKISTQTGLLTDTNSSGFATAKISITKLEKTDGEKIVKFRLQMMEAGVSKSQELWELFTRVIKTTVS